MIFSIGRTKMWEYSTVEGFKEFRESGKLEHGREWALRTKINPRKKVYFHGTSTSRLPDIKENGLCNRDCRIDKSGTYDTLSCKDAVYLTEDMSGAINYSRASAKGGESLGLRKGDPVVLVIDGYDLTHCDVHPDWHTMTTWTHEVDGKRYMDVVVMGCGCIDPEEIKILRELDEVK